MVPNRGFVITLWSCLSVVFRLAAHVYGQEGEESKCELLAITKCRFHLAKYGALKLTVTVNAVAPERGRI